MEKKDSMGLPPSPPPASFNGIHAKSTQTPSQFTPGPPTLVHNPTPLRPDATRAAALVSDLPGRTIAATPLAAASPPPHIPDHTSSTTAIVPHPGSLMTPAVYMGAETVKKKRGRPRKYAPDGTVAITIKPVIPGPLSPLHKRGRGRPPGSGKKQQLAALVG